MSKRKIVTKTTGRPSLTRLGVATLTCGLSVPFLGLRRKHRSVTVVKR
jgi:hypothetical protein